MLENFRLKVFRAVAQQLSFRKAAEELYLTQPAVTLQVKALEEEVGAKLFDRGSKGVALTEAGILLLRYADQLHRLALQAEAALSDLKGEATGQLVLGASTTVAQYVLPRMLADFSRRYPAIQLQVFSANTEHVAEGVSANRFELGLIEGPAHRRDVTVQPWFDDELLLVVPSGHEWAGLNDVPAEKVADAPLVMRERGSGTRHVVESGLQEAGLRLGSLRIVMELDSTEAILSCIAAGLGVGFVSEWAVARRAADHSLSTLRLSGRVISRSFSFVLPQGPELTGPAAMMLQFLRNSVPSPERGTSPRQSPRIRETTISAPVNSR